MKSSSKYGLVSSKIRLFTDSAIREVSALANATGAVNLAQGSPDFPSPAPVKEAAVASCARLVWHK